jgi:serine/threonine-protein kinase
MELIEGESLFQILQKIGNEGHRNWKPTLRCAIHVARALQVVHEHGVVHRSVTPPNILVRTTDLTAKLGDTLFAKALETAAADEISSSGEYVGNVYYMAPERTQQAAKVDGRADLYSLGATLYHFLTSRLPFQGTSMAEVISKIRGSAPEKIRKFNAKVPEPLEKIIMRLLAKKPEERYLSARELLRELESIAKANRIEP